MSMAHPENDNQAWADRIEGIREIHRIPGIAVGIVRGGNLDWFQGFGESELGGGAPPTERSVFRVASNTKTFTASALMILQESSMLTLDDPLLLHIPEFTSAAGIEGDLEDVTLRRLATHHAGLTTEHPSTDWDAPEFPTMDEMLRRIDEVQMVIPVDSAWKYSNMAYGFLGEVISRLSGQPYERFVQHELLDRVGMAATVFEYDEIAPENRVVGYSQPSIGSDVLRVAPYRPLNGLNSAGQLMSNVEDLAKWLALHALGYASDSTRLMNCRSRREMLHPVYLDSSWSTGQCIGWRANRNGDHVFQGHGGGIHGFGTQTLFHEASQTGVIVLTNLWPNSITAHLSSLLLKAALDLDADWDEQPSAPEYHRPNSDNSSKLRKYEGPYYAEPGCWLEIIATSDEALCLGNHESSPYNLHSPAGAQLVDEDTFKVVDGRAAGETFAIRDGQFRLGGFKYSKVD